MFILKKRLTCLKLLSEGYGQDIRELSRLAQVNINWIYYSILPLLLENQLVIKEKIKSKQEFAGNKLFSYKLTEKGFEILELLNNIESKIKEGESNATNR